MVEKVIDRGVDICLTCVLPDCDEKADMCLLYHPVMEEIKQEEGGSINISQLSKEEKKAIAFEAHQRGVQVVADEKGIPMLTIRAWVGAWCRKPKEKIDKAPMSNITHKSVESVKQVNQYSIQIDMRLIDNMLSQESIVEARAFWAGVKAARGI